MLALYASAMLQAHRNAQCHSLATILQHIEYVKITPALEPLSSYKLSSGIKIYCDTGQLPAGGLALSFTFVLALLGHLAEAPSTFLMNMQ